MANVDAPFGLAPTRHLDGSPYNGQHRYYYTPSSLAGDIFIGDPVIALGDANDNEVQGYAAATIPEVTIATAGDGNIITGVVVGVLPVTNDSTIYREASTERILMVCDDPDVIYEIQDDGAGALVADTVGLNAVMIAGGGGSTTTGRSSWELDGNADPPAADQSNQLFIYGLSKKEGNEVGDFAIWEVLINTHQYHGGATGRILGIA